MSLEKHLLVTISEDINALYGLRFVHGFFSNPGATRLTLFYVSPRQQGSGGFEAGAPFCEPKQATACRQPPSALTAARDWLLGMGFPAGRIALKSAPAKLGTVKDIAAEAERGLYDAVVLGRRGLSWFDEIFQDSVTHRLLWETISFPLWVCRNPKKGNKNVLLCVDGSEECQRIADHVGFVLRDDPGHNVTVLHNRALDLPEDTHIEEIMRHAAQALTSNGVGDERIEFLVKSSKDPVELILKQAAQGAYAAVAIGRSNGRPEGLAKHLFGSISLSLLRKLESSALWISK